MTDSLISIDQSKEKISAQNILPFIELDQYLDFVTMCNFVREYRYMALLLGPAGAGKTVSAKRYRDEEPLMTANGQSPVLYFQLARGEENHKAFYRRVIEAITQVPYQKRLSAADLIGEAKRLLRRYEYDLIIVDEIGNMNNDGLEGARTLHDETGLPIVFIGMDNNFKNRLETELPQFNSRIAEITEFGLLSYVTLKNEVLPLVSPKSYLSYSSQQKDADKIARALFKAAGGSGNIGACFRDVQVFLVRCHDILQERITLRNEDMIENPSKRPPKIPVFDAKIVDLAVQKSKQRGKRPNTILNLSGQNDSIVRDGESPNVSPQSNTESSGTD